MITETLTKLYRRDLSKLKYEIESYKNADKLWVIDKQISNSGGNLCLHLIGNLNTYIGAELGNTGYIRNRPEEFSLKNIPAHELVVQIEQTMLVVDTTLSALTEAQLKAEYPKEVADGRVSTEYFLVHLAMHLSYHLGQINYHRRMLDN